MSVGEVRRKEDFFDNRDLGKLLATDGAKFTDITLQNTPGCVARTLGHVDTSMVYRTYGRYIPNLTRTDGSAFESQWAAGLT